LPRLSEAESLLVAPLAVRGELVGALVIESREPLAFGRSDEVAVELIAQHLAARVIEVSLEDEEAAGRTRGDGDAGSAGPLSRFVFYQVDDSVFLDDEYLIRGVPGRILWRLLTEYSSTGRRDFSNRELRMSPWIGLPTLRDNLESRLILLRRRLDEKQTPVRIERTGRGRFSLVLDGPIDLLERDSP
ncbi:MAG: GAF domain-containing protein, partial [Dehalococcoidia bacterium]|nr:GAF domain-containing protein [Dehalococcoidia bacterium]